ncbi:hypothetical protein BAE44_0008760, partial [Dichanthelium oligosanthes]
LSASDSWRILGRVYGRLDREFSAALGVMAADSSMGFHQGITASMYNHHMLSFQSNSDVGISVGATGGMVMAPRSVSGSSSNAGLFLSPNTNTGVIGNPSGVGPSRSSSGDVFRGTGPHKYKFVTGSPSDWSERELSILKEGLARYAREPNIMRYIKIAAMLPNRTIRDVALRCWWGTVKSFLSDVLIFLPHKKGNLFIALEVILAHGSKPLWSADLIQLLQGKDRRKKPDGFYIGKKIRDMKPIQEKMVASVPMASFHMTPTNNVTPFSISMQHPNQQNQVPKEAPVVDSATQRLLEENNQLLNQIAANIETFKTVENTDLFLRTSNNIKAILSRMSETPGIMGQMASLPLSVNEDHLNSLIQLNRMSEQHCLVMKGCIVWDTKHFSSYEARATKLMYHILRGK